MELRSSRDADLLFQLLSQLMWMAQGFVQFADAGGAQKAREAIHGRLFAGVTVQVAFISQQEFAAAGN